MSWLKRRRGYPSSREPVTAFPKVPAGPGLGGGCQVIVTTGLPDGYVPPSATLTLPVTPPEQRDAAARAVAEGIRRYEQTGGWHRA